VYVPAACAAGGACRLHVAMHGCGMGASFANTEYELRFARGCVGGGGGGGGVAGARRRPPPHTQATRRGRTRTGWVILFPQGGYFHEQGLPAPSAQIGAGCFDGAGWGEAAARVRLLAEPCCPPPCRVWPDRAQL